MRIFSLDNVFSYGPYSGLSLRDVLEQDFAFIDKLLRQNENFIIDPFDWQYIIRIHKFSKKATKPNKINIILFNT